MANYLYDFTEETRMLGNTQYTLNTKVYVPNACGHTFAASDSDFGSDGKVACPVCGKKYTKAQARKTF